MAPLLRVSHACSFSGLKLHAYLCLLLRVGEDASTAVKKLPVHYMALFPFSAALFPNFVQAVIFVVLNSNCPQINKEYRIKFCLIPNVTGSSAQTDQAVQFLRRVIPMMKSGSHVCISKIVYVFSLGSPCIHLWPLLLTWFNFNLSIDK